MLSMMERGSLALALFRSVVVALERAAGARQIKATRESATRESSS